MHDVSGPSSSSNSKPDTYRGRFAPSPTGPLHFGSLIAAVGSYLQAKSKNGLWFLRIDDIDIRRTAKGATDRICRDLEAFGFRWDDVIMYQTKRQELYDEALQLLAERDLTFRCACSRKSLPPGPYPGICRNGIAANKRGRSIRMRVEQEVIGFNDQIQGEYGQDLAQQVGDFLLHRGDGITAYQLAVVIDDADQKITEVVRGCDLLDSTPRQIYLQQKLGLPTPHYAHLPIAVNPQGKKLSKQTRARSIDQQTASAELLAALNFLGQRPETELEHATPEEILGWAIEHWDINKVPKQAEIVIKD